MIGCDDDMMRCCDDENANDEVMVKKMKPVKKQPMEHVKGDHIYEDNYDWLWLDYGCDDKKDFKKLKKDKIWTFVIKVYFRQLLN